VGCRVRVEKTVSSTIGGRLVWSTGGIQFQSFVHRVGSYRQVAVVEVVVTESGCAWGDPRELLASHARLCQALLLHATGEIPHGKNSFLPIKIHLTTNVFVIPASQWTSGLNSASGDGQPLAEPLARVKPHRRSVLARVKPLSLQTYVSTNPKAPPWNIVIVHR
jgi:hypothetical protein